MSEKLKGMLNNIQKDFEKNTEIYKNQHELGKLTYFECLTLIQNERRNQTLAAISAVVIEIEKK